MSEISDDMLPLAFATTHNGIVDLEMDDSRLVNRGCAYGGMTMLYSGTQFTTVAVLRLAGKEYALLAPENQVEGDEDKSASHD